MKNFYRIVILILVVTIFLGINIFNYFKIQKDNENQVSICENKIEKYEDPIDSTKDISEKFVGVINNPDSCFCKMYTRLLPRFLVYKVKHNKKELEFIRPSFNKYFVPTLILEKADVFVSYGIANNIEFEYLISELYKKNLYAFDCGIRKINKQNKYIFFESECIGLDDYVLTEIGQISSGKVHKFEEKLKELKLEDKKIYLKMNVVGAELVVLPDIIKHHKNLTGMSIVIKFSNSQELIKLEKLLKDIEENFVLVSRYEFPDNVHCDCHYKSKNLATTVTLTYINKEYVDDKYMPFKQNYNEKGKYEKMYKLGNFVSKFDVDWILIISEKIKLLFGEI